MADTMEVLQCAGPGRPLILVSRPVPVPAAGQVLVRVEACAVCRTDLHVTAGELPGVAYPIVPGHQVVGTVAAAGDGAVVPPGTRVGVAWLAWACGDCGYCRSNRENLCDAARFHGYQVDGGFGEYLLADSRFCFPLPTGMPAATTAPLLCGGLIGYRSLRLAGEPEHLGLYGFGSAAHLLTQVARHQGRRVYAFTRPGDREAQAFARSLGAVWAGPSDAPPPVPLDAAIIFAPVGALVPLALRAVRKGGSVVCGGIHMSPIPSFPYADLWGERQLRSVANLTRQDGREFLALAAACRLQGTVTTYPLTAGNDALADLAHGRLRGTAVLVPGPAQ